MDFDGGNFWVLVTLAYFGARKLGAQRRAREAEAAVEDSEPVRAPLRFRFVDRGEATEADHACLDQIEARVGRPAAEDIEPEIGDAVTTFVEVPDGDSHERIAIVARACTTLAERLHLGPSHELDIPRSAIASIFHLTGGPRPLQEATAAS